MFRLNPNSGRNRRRSAGESSLSRQRELEVRREMVRGSGERAARRDLESERPLATRTAFQDGLQAAQGEAASNRIERAVAEIGAVDEELADVECEKEWRAADIEQAGDRLKEAGEKRDAVPKPRRFGRISILAYATIMALFSAAEYPLLKLSFTRLPVDDQTIRVISVLVGATLVAGTHVLALAVARLMLAEGDRIEGRRDWFAHVAVVVVGVGAYAFVVVGLAFVRAGEIVGIGETFAGHGVSHPVWFGVALGCLHAATLLAAFYVAYYRARGAEWRDAQLAVESREAEKTDATEALETVERREVRLHVRREVIADSADHDLDRLRRHHRLEESKYLGILARAFDDPPKPISDWDTSRTPRTRHLPPSISTTRTSWVSGNGKRLAASTPSGDAKD